MSTPLLRHRYRGGSSACWYWRKKDRPMIREMHRRLDGYWEGKYGAKE